MVASQQFYLEVPPLLSRNQIPLKSLRGMLNDFIYRGYSKGKSSSFLNEQEFSFLLEIFAVLLHNPFLQHRTNNELIVSLWNGIFKISLDVVKF